MWRFETNRMSEFKRSEQIDQLAAALAKAKLTYGTVVRTKENTYTGSKYAELQDLMDAIQKPLAENGLSFIHFPIQVVDAKKAGALTLLLHSSGQFIGNELILPATGKATGGAEKFDAQTIGAAITYAKRYNVQGLGDVVGESEDDGNEIADKSADSAVPVPKPKTVAAPKVNPAPANKGAETRPERDKSAPKVTPEPPPAQQGRPQTDDPTSSATTLPPKATIPADTLPPASESTPVEPKISETSQAAKQTAAGEKPTKSQLDAYIARVRDEIKPALEKAGLRPSAKLQTGAKLKNYILFQFGTDAKELTELTVSQWDAFIATFNEKGAPALVTEIEGGNK